MKKMFLALLTTLLLLLAATTALAVSPSDYNCLVCGEPCTEWYSYNGEDGTVSVHAPACYICYAIVWDTVFPCTPAEGTATCISPARCSICGSPDWIGSAPDPNAHGDMSRWFYAGPTQHYRYCLDCVAEASYEYEDHYGGTATCSKPAICEGCGSSYGELSTEHAMSEWKSISTTQHRKYCTLCWGVETIIYEDHYGGTATCWELAVCEGCGNAYGDYDYDNHNWGDWVWLNGSTHLRECRDCPASEEGNHSGGTATCTERAICEVCNAGYGELAADAHSWGEWTPNADGTHTRVCKLNAEHTETVDCTWGDWTHLTHIHHERRCTICNGQELGEHSGGTLTCYSPRICDVCNEVYGSPDNSGLSGHPNPVIEQKPATCYEEGYYRVTCDHPGCSMPFFEIILPANGQHIYHDWQPTGDGSHIAACHYCSEELTVPCTVFTAELFAACPICGEYEGGVLAVIYAHDDDESLPYGTLVIRGGEIPVDGAMCAITVTGSYGGQVVELIAPVTVSLPMELTGFRIIDMNGEEIPFTLENGMLTFETATAGLFLLVPAE